MKRSGHKERTAFLLISHGSRAPRSGQEVASLAKKIFKKSKLELYGHAFLEVCEPTIPQGIQRLVARGATQVIVLLNFLNSGNHVKRDIPGIVKEAKRRHPGVRFLIAPPIGLHPSVPNLFIEHLDLLKQKF